MTGFHERLETCARLVTEHLAETLSDTPRAGEIARPPKLFAAMRHAVLNGGKRLRPFLVIETAGLFGVAERAALPAAAALECVHCYSLVHDDLPAMDDDDLRRGQPTVHRAFDEATAILTGDGLLTMAFALIADPACHADSAIRAELALKLAHAAGAGGMAGGQAFDLAAAETRPGIDETRQLQAMKTGALIRFACEAGAILAAAPLSDRRRLARFGQSIGAAFQLADDLLDVTASAAATGKKTAKDAKSGKATLVAMLGVEAAWKEAENLVEAAIAELEPFAERAAHLRDCARYVIERDH